MVTASAVVAGLIVSSTIDATAPLNSQYSIVNFPPKALARNLPESTGASGAQRGKTVALVPILKMQQYVIASSSALGNDLKTVQDYLSEKYIPSEEKEFKRLFDEYSVGISYKQQYLDKNAFLVYYTKGFDGPNRQSIETEDAQMKLQMAQYGFRNDAWVAVDDARAEVSYLLEQQQSGARVDRRELEDALKRAVSAFKGYIDLAPKEQVTEGLSILK